MNTSVHEENSFSSLESSSHEDEIKLRNKHFLEETRPYKGLASYTEEDCEIFYCRDREIDQIITKLKLWRFTILYGKSGVGKSSLIHAGVVHNLLEEAKKNIINYGVPKLAVVVFPFKNNQENDFSGYWSQEIREIIKEKIEAQIESINKKIYDEGYPISTEFSLPNLEPNDSLQITLKKWSQEIDGTIYFIFDQFEDHFFEDDFSNSELGLELIGIINNFSIPLHPLVVIREDFLAKLDCFKGKIDNPFEHRLEVKYLNNNQAQQAIIKPLKYYNQKIHLYNQKTNSALLKVEIDNDKDVSELPSVILCQNEVGDGIKEPIELLLLQLVMKAIWEKEVKKCYEQNKSKIQLTKETFENLGKTHGIARKHLENSIKKLSEIKELKDKDADQLESILAVLFQNLVSAAARQIPQTLEELENDQHLKKDYRDHELSPLTRDQLKIALDNLAKSRILRTLPNQQYEIFHKIFCKVILEWQDEKIKELEKIRTKKELEKTIHNVSRVAQNLAFQASQKYQNREYDLSLVLARQAYDFYQKIPGGQGLGIIQKVLRELLENPDQFNSQPLFTHCKEVSVVAFSSHGNWLASGCYDGTVNIYRTDNIKQLFSSLKCQNEEVRSLAFSPVDENILAVGSDNGNVYLADITQENSQLNYLYSHEKQEKISSLAFSPEGKYLASGSWDQTVQIFDVQNSTPKRIFYQEHDDWVWSVAFNPQKTKPFQLAVGCRNGVVRLWHVNKLDQQDQQQFQDLSTHVAQDWSTHKKNILQEREIFCVAFAPDGNTLAAGGRDTIIRLWNMKNIDPCDPSPQPPEELIGHQNMVRSLAFSPDGKLLASGSDDKNIRIWHWQDEQHLSMVFKAENSLGGEKLGVSSLAFNPDLNKPMLVSGSWNYPKDNTPDQSNVFLWHWNRNAPTSVIVLEGHEGVVKALEFSNCNQYLVSTGYDRTVKRWTLERDPQQPSIIVNDTLSKKPTDFSWGEKQQQELRTLALSKKDPLVAAAGIDGIVRVWDLHHPDQLIDELPVERQEVRSLAFSEDGQWLASGGSQENSQYLVHLWKYIDQHFIFQGSQSEQLTGNLYRGLDDQAPKQEQKTVRALAFSCDNKWLLTGGEDHIIRLWNFNDYHQPISAKELEEAITWVAFNPDGKWMAAATEKEKIYLWPTPSESDLPFAEESQIVWHGGGCLAFSPNPNSQKLASGSRNGVIYLWDVEQPKAVPILLKGHHHGIRAIAFSHDGQYLASASDDQTIRIWVVEISTLAKIADQWVPDRPLTQKERTEFVGNDFPYEKYDALPISTER